MAKRKTKSKEPEVINFFSTTCKYGCFSNLSLHAVVLQGKRWPTSEHYFQAQKFVHEDQMELVRLARTAMSAGKMGRERKWETRRDWDRIKEKVMIEVLRAKFTQHEDLKAILLGTGNLKLVKHSSRDTYWGDGRDGSGKNRLGVLLMRLRAELRAEAEAAPTA